MLEMSETAKALKSELIQMSDRKREIDRILNTLEWRDSLIIVEDEKTKLNNINFYDFEYWSPSSRHC